MGQPAAVMGDVISGTCRIHQIPAAGGGPAPAGPLPFAAPLTQGLATTVRIAGQPAAVAGSSGVNTNAPHVGLHGTDPFAVPSSQVGRVAAGSTTVLVEGKQAAHTGCQVTLCAEPGSLTGSAVTVVVG